MTRRRPHSIPAAIFVSILLAASPVYSGPQPAVQPGEKIGPVTLGMTEDQVKRAMGASVSPGAIEGQPVLNVPSQGLTIWISVGRVARVRTTNPAHKTVAGFAPGDTGWQIAKQALCNGGLSEASALRTMSGGFEFWCPFRGVMVEVSGDRVTSISVIPRDRLSSGASP